MIVGTVGDLHSPFVHPMYRRFCEDTFDLCGVDRTHLAGDIVDQHALGFWDHDPNGMSASCEQKAAFEIIQKWYAIWPKATVSIGNHDHRNYRVARKGGLPDLYLKSYSEVWQTPKWDWDFEFVFDGVLYTHGTGVSGKDAALNLALQRRQSVVIGHVHSWAGVKWHANTDSTIFGMNSGCGIDCKAYAFAYGKEFPVRPILGCGVVVDGEQALFFRMQCDVGEKYHRSRASKAEQKLYRL